MKHLVLVRHAKSSWKQQGLDDFDRPLNARGERDAADMAERLAARMPAPDALVSSTAARAMATARELARGFGLEPRAIQGERELYLASVDTWLVVIRALDDDWSRVLLVGHNPGITILLEALTGAGVPDLPTCAVAELALDVDSWRAVAPRGARLASLDSPKSESKE